MKNPDAVLTFQLVAQPGDRDVSDYARGAHAWAEIGIVQVDSEADIRITLVRPPDLLETEGTEALADRANNAIAIDARVTGFRLLVAVAHEVGHVVLDTEKHTTCGVMGGMDVALCDEDRTLACETIGACP